MHPHRVSSASPSGRCPVRPRLWRPVHCAAPRGHGVRLEGVPFTIIGVTGSEFTGPEVGRTFDVAVPLNCEPLIRGDRSALGARGSFWLQVMLRLAPGQSAAQATQALRAVQADIAEETRPANLRPEDAARFLAHPFTIRPGATVGGIRDQYQSPVVALMAVRSGVIPRTAKVRVVRDGVEVYDGTLASLKRFKDDVREVREGFECGIGVENFNDVKVGDLIEAYKIEQIARSLDQGSAAKGA